MVIVVPVLVVLLPAEGELGNGFVVSTVSILNPGEGVALSSFPCSRSVDGFLAHSIAVAIVGGEWNF